MTSEDNQSSEPDVTEVITEGVLRVTENGCELSYEMGADEDPNGKIEVILDGESFSFIRRGAYAADFQVERGIKNHTIYRMPLGNLTVGVLGRELEHDIGSDSGSICVKYEIDFNSALAAAYVLTISYKSI